MDDDNDFRVDGVYTQDRDMNNNGIPDRQEPANQEPSSIEFGPSVASIDPYERSLRERQAHLGGTYDTSEVNSRDRRRRDRVDEANREVSAFQVEVASNPDKKSEGRSYKDAVQQQAIRRARAAKDKKATLLAELSSMGRPKDDPKTGLEIGKEIWLGMVAGAKYEEKRHEANIKAANLEKADKMEREAARERDGDSLINAREERDKAFAADKALAADGGTPSGPDGAGPGGAGPDGGGPGPDDAGPGGAGPGGDGPGSGQSTDPVQTPDPSGQPTSEPAQAPSEIADPIVPANDPGTAIPTPVEVPERVAATAPAAEPSASARTPEAVEPTRDPMTKEVEPATVPQEAIRTQAADSASARAPAAGARTPSDLRRQSGSAADPTEATGSAGMGMALTAVNPVAGIAVGAAGAKGAQAEAGSDFRSGTSNPKVADGANRAAASAATTSKGPNSGRPAAAPRGRSLGQPAPQATARILEFKRPESKPGRLTEQAAAAKRPPQPVLSKGPSAPPARPRAIGLGGAIAGMVIASRPEPQRDAGSGIDPALAAAYQKQRDESGRGM